MISRSIAAISLLNQDLPDPPAEVWAKNLRGEKVSIRIDKDLYDKIVLYLKDIHESSMDVAQFVEYIARRVLEILEEDSTVLPDEKRELKERLRGLGYL